MRGLHHGKKGRTPKVGHERSPFTKTLALVILDEEEKGRIREIARRIHDEIQPSMNFVGCPCSASIRRCY